MVTIVAGEETNIKITRPIDLLIAERYLQERG
jgi:2-C-methyl-D-erythritol 4-phosphate cytidylyltransferase